MTKIQQDIYDRLLQTDVTAENGEKIYYFLKNECNIKKEKLEILSRSKSEYFEGILMFGAFLFIFLLTIISMGYAINGEGISGGYAFLLWLASAFMFFFSGVGILAYAELMLNFPIQHLVFLKDKKYNDELSEKLRKIL